MNRRELFRCLPSAVLSIPGAVMAASEPEKPAAEPSPWVELTCQMKGYGRYPDCGTKFKAVRGAHPVCPVCGCMQDVSSEELRPLFSGIEVK